MAKRELVEPDDPRRCQAVTNSGQCNQKAVEGRQFCQYHHCNGNHKKDEADLRNYRLTKFKAELDRHAGSPNIKSLRDEIGILRMVLEERLNQMQDAQDLIFNAGPIAMMVDKIERVVSSCHKLEAATGQLLDKQAILQFATQLITIISEEISDEEALSRLSDKVTNLIMGTFNDESEIT